MPIDKEAAERKFRDEAWQEGRDKWYKEWRRHKPTLTYADYVDHLMERIRRS